MTGFVSPTTARNAGKTHTQHNWTITTTKYPICKSSEIDALTAALGIAPPEMIFGNNSVRVRHEPSGFELVFAARDALDVVDKTGSAGMLKVAYSEEWQRMREKVSEDIRDVVRPFDWSYSTGWRGRVSSGSGSGSGGNELTVVADAEIPYEKLRRPDPILLFDDVMLYEDELADNGIAMLSVKVRVMPERLLVLQRFFLRLDGVVVRIRDTRVYVEFETGEVIREYVSREAKYADVKKVCFPSQMRERKSPQTKKNQTKTTRKKTHELRGFRPPKQKEFRNVPARRYPQFTEGPEQTGRSVTNHGNHTRENDSKVGSVYESCDWHS